MQTRPRPPKKATVVISSDSDDPDVENVKNENGKKKRTPRVVKTKTPLLLQQVVKAPAEELSDRSGDVPPSLPSAASDLWVDTYSPLSNITCELAIHAKKVASVRSWLMERAAHAPVLVLQGPSGSGKSACIEYLCRETGIQCILWQDDDVPIQDAASISTGFAPFARSLHLMQTIKHLASYSTLSLSSPSIPDSSPSMISDTADQKQTVVVLEHVPLYMSSYRRSLAELLESIAREQAALPLHARKVRLVLVLSDQMGLSQSDMHDILPTSFTSQLDLVHTIKFNPVAPTLLKKCLSTVLSMVDGCHLKRKRGKALLSFDMGPLDQLVELAQGDIRSALHHLQFWHLDRTLPFTPHLYGRHHAKSLFQVLGHALHKKEESLDLNGLDHALSLTGIDGGLLMAYFQDHYVHFCDPGDVTLDAWEDDALEAVLSPLSSLLSDIDTISHLPPHLMKPDDALLQVLHLVPLRTSQIILQARPTKKAPLYALHRPASLDAAQKCREMYRSYHATYWQHRLAAVHDTVQESLPFGTSYILDLLPYIK